MICHIMNIWERILDRKLREKTSIGEAQFGVMPSRRDNCREAGDGETPGDAEGTAHGVY